MQQINEELERILWLNNTRQFETRRAMINSIEATMRLELRTRIATTTNSFAYVLYIQDVM